MQRIVGVLMTLVLFASVCSSVSVAAVDCTYIKNNLELTGISAVQKMKDDNGDPLNGKGVTISIIDTGIPEESDDRVIDQFNFCDNTEDITDGLGHGTKVKHIISTIAPEASILAYRVFLLENKQPSVEAITNAIKRSIEHKADIINISGGIYANNVLLSNAIEEAVQQGIIVVSGAGNEGRDCGITSPGNEARVITVGATTLDGNDVAEYSSCGPDPDTGEIKPDVVAPGEYQWGCRGTSFAAPIVTGAIALLRQKHPAWTCRDIKSALGSTAVPLTRNGEVLLPICQGSGRVDVLKAITTCTLFSSAIIRFDRHIKKLKIRNIGDKPLRYSLQWTWDGSHAGLMEQVLPSSFTLKPNEEISVTLSMKTDPFQVDKCWYYPALKVTSEDSEWNIPIVVDNPYAFIEEA